MKKIFNKLKEFNLSILFISIVFIILVALIIKFIIVNTITPVEEIHIEVIDSITDVNNDIKYRINNLDSIRNENIKKSLNLDDSTTIELFKWLLSK